MDFFSSWENISLLVGLVGSLCGLVISIIKLFKEKNYTKLSTICSFIPDLIRLAETTIVSDDSSVKLGAIRLRYVLSNLHELCIQNNVVFNEDVMTSYIEEYLHTPSSKEYLGGNENETSTSKLTLR